MLFLFGLKNHFEQIDTLDTTCPQCGRKPCGLYLSARKASVYRLSVATLKRTYVVGCKHCDKYWDIDQDLAQRLHGLLQGQKPAAASAFSATTAQAAPFDPTSDKAKEALVEAARAGQTDVVKSLLKHGVDVNARDLLGETALLAAAEEGHLKVVRFLLDRGADVNARHATLSWTALIQAAAEGHARLLRPLLDAGADINARDNSGATALLRAAENSRAEAVKLLIEKGADVNAMSYKGFTPLMRAFVNGHAHIEELLRKAGAK
jgi:hypothetical protein